jgi:multicomponent Na+:H+ antiporter subunit G
MNEFAHVTLLILGAMFLLAAAIGVVRMPDLFTRMQAATKAATLGISCIFGAVALYMEDLSVAMRAFLTIGFFFLTAPVAAHMIGRAAYFIGVPLWEESIVDELSGHYDRRTHTLTSGSTPAVSEHRPSSASHSEKERP